jgi:hypothetical protein
MKGRPILVTGSIRSGTTWVGKLLGTAPGIAVIHEPFNVDHQLGMFAHRWSYQYTYLTEGAPESTSVEDALRDTLSYKYRPLLHIRKVESLPRSLGLLRDLPRSWFRRHVSHPRPLLKDPIALFSAEWLAERFDMDVVIMIRHPGAFAWSYVRIAEPNRLTDLIQQRSLREGPLQPFADEIERAARAEDPIHQAAVLWRVIYATVTGFQERHPEWVVVRHEDLSTHPYDTFPDLLARLDLPFTEKTRRFIELTTNGQNPVEAPGHKLHHIRRNSLENVIAWQRRLSQSEISQIRGLTEDVSGLYYTDSSWPRSPWTVPIEATSDASS